MDRAGSGDVLDRLSALGSGRSALCLQDSSTRRLEAEDLPRQREGAIQPGLTDEGGKSGSASGSRPLAGDEPVGSEEMTRHVVATVDEIPAGGRKIVTVNGREIGIFKVGDGFYGLFNRCPHQGAPLCRGEIV